MGLRPDTTTASVQGFGNVAQYAIELYNQIGGTVACVSCCWALMALVFVVGVVSLGWMAALTMVVCAEKLLPRAHLLSRLLGVGLACAGIALLISPG